MLRITQIMLYCPQSSNQTLIQHKNAIYNSIISLQNSRTFVGVFVTIGVPTYTSSLYQEQEEMSSALFGIGNEDDSLWVQTNRNVINYKDFW